MGKGHRSTTVVVDQLDLTAAQASEKEELECNEKYEKFKIFIKTQTIEVCGHLETVRYRLTKEHTPTNIDHMLLGVLSRECRNYNHCDICVQCPTVLGRIEGNKYTIKEAV